MTKLSERALTFAEMQEFVVRGSLELFAHYGMPVEHSLGGAADVNGPAVMAVIGYAADDVRGSLLMLTSIDVVAALEPAELRAAGVAVEVALRDVLGEFANMLLGRLKNQLVARQVAPLLATPTTVFGHDLILPAPKSGISAWHTFAASAGKVFVRFDATFEGDFALGPEAEATPPPLLEGEMIIF